MEACKQNIYPAEFTDLHRLENELRMIRNPKVLLESFVASYNQETMEQLVAVMDTLYYLMQPVNQIQEPMEQAMQHCNNAEDLATNAYEILRVKQDVELKLNEIISASSLINNNLKVCLSHYQELHKFSNRAEEFGDILQVIRDRAMMAVIFLKKIISFISDQQLCTVRFNDMYENVYQVMLRAGFTNPLYIQRDEVLINSTLYDNCFDQCLKRIQDLEWEVHQKFTLIMTKHPPAVIPEGSTPRLFSIEFLNLNNNMLEGNVRIKVYMIGEDKVKEIQSSKRIPDVISNIQPNDNNEANNWTAVSGLIALRSTGNTTNISNTPGYPMVHMDNIWDNTRPYNSFESNLIVKVIANRGHAGGKDAGPGPSRKRGVCGPGKAVGTSNEHEGVANSKVALLFVLEMPFSNEIRTVWALSLPFIVTTHCSQLEKAWGAMSWDEVVPKPERLGFEVETGAYWTQIREMLNGTFEYLVGEHLKESHLKFLRWKMGEMMCGDRNEITNQTVIPRAALFEVPKPVGQKVAQPNSFGNVEAGTLGVDLCKSPSPVSPFSFYFESLLVVQKGGPFSKMYKDGHIIGFIHDDEACRLLEDHTIQHGTTILKFTETWPGNLTPIVKWCDNKGYKIKPIFEIRKKNCMEQYIEELLPKLKTKVFDQELYKFVYPDHPKKLAFGKFYNYKKKKNPIVQGTPRLPPSYTDGKTLGLKPPTILLSSEYEMSL